MRISATSHLTMDAEKYPKTGLAVLFLLCVLSAGEVSAAPGIRPQDIPEALAKQGQNVTSLKAVMDVSTVHDRGKERNEIRGFLLYRRPSDFRFQGLVPGGNPLFEMVIKSTGFDLFVPTDRKILKGTPKCFTERFPDIAEMREVIPLALSQWKNARLEGVIAQDRDKIVVKLSFGGAIWNATLTTDKLLVTRLVRVGSRGPELSADFAGFKDGEHGWIPRAFQVHSPLGDWTTTVTIRQLEVNPFVVEKNFQLDPPYSPTVEQCK